MSKNKSKVTPPLEKIYIYIINELYTNEYPMLWNITATVSIYAFYLLFIYLQRNEYLKRIYYNNSETFVYFVI